MGMMPPIRCVEGKPIALEPRLQKVVRLELARLRQELRPRLPLLHEDESGMRIRNLVGTIDAGRGQTLEIVPKTEPGDDWVAGILALLIGAERIDIAGERSAGLAREQRSLVESLAAIYAARLDLALRRDGPLMVMSRQRIRSESLSGRLDVTRWSRQVLTDPTAFPVEVSRLTADNPFSETLAYVALRLANASRRSVTRVRLRNAASLLRPGLPDAVGVPGGAWRSRLPPQWSVYRPAWSIAGALLGRRSLLGPEGPHSGVSIAIEPWPLLETLLHRSLRSAALQANADGRPFRAESPWRLQLLTPAGGSSVPQDPIKPDSVMFEDGRIFAVFDAKYKDYETAGLKREDVYQVITAARAAGARIAVLAYPGNSSPAWWDVGPESGNPLRLATIGLGMFSYRPGGEVERGRQLLELVS